jgi:hypothetical protein
MAGENAALWQVQTNAANGTEATALAADADNVALFNDTAKVIGTASVSYLSDITVDFRRAVPENEAVNTDNNELQDMGIEGFDIVLVGRTGLAGNDDASNFVNKISKWLQDGNTLTTGTFLASRGRYGLRLDNAPQWDVVPAAGSNGYGYHIRSANFRYIGEDKLVAEFTIRLALGGDIATAI